MGTVIHSSTFITSVVTCTDNACSSQPTEIKVANTRVSTHTHTHTAKILLASSLIISRDYSYSTASISPAFQHSHGSRAATSFD